ncbi:MAG: type II 3-dehydroquinate dehydratase [Fusobacteria bacterium]|nr:type II 3-dehydroquinate dehydratase [Fusobacteriota bacterium]
MKIAIINGPNLNALGQRERNIYGNTTLEDLEALWFEYGKKKNIEIITYQSNLEGEIINYLYDNQDTVDGYIINPGALTHYSYSLRDCLAAVYKPVIEVHISNIEAREEFRKLSVVSPVVQGKVAGFGLKGYLLAIDSFLLSNE